MADETFGERILRKLVNFNEKIFMKCPNLMTQNVYEYVKGKELEYEEARRKKIAGGRLSSLSNEELPSSSDKPASTKTDSGGEKEGGLGSELCQPAGDNSNSKEGVATPPPVTKKEGEK